MKFGGTSVQSPEHIQKVARYVIEQAQRGVKPVVVVSAMGQATDRILDLFSVTCPGAPSREYDQAMATGEQVSAALLAGTICCLGGKAKSLIAQQMHLTAGGGHRQGKIQAIRDAQQMIEDLKAGQILVCAGFQGITPKGEIVTLGRGGSDTTAVALAHVTEASCDIYTDVRGVYAVDPRIVPTAKRLPFITYADMLAMSSAGAGVLMDRSVMLAQRLGIPLRVKLSPSLGETDEGTLVYFRDEDEQTIEVEGLAMTGLAVRNNIAAVTIGNIVNQSGEAAKIFGSLADVMIGDAIQGKSGPVASISLWISEEDVPKVTAAIPDCSIQRDTACLTLVSPGMKEGKGYLARMTSALAKAGANIEMIATAGESILVIIHKDHIKQAACQIAEEFGLCG